MALQAIDDPRNEPTPDVDPTRAQAARPSSTALQGLTPLAVATPTEDGWVTCASCGMDVRAEALERHRATQH